MSAIVKSYSGYWSIPTFSGESVDCPGTLTLSNDEGLILDIHHSENVGREINVKNAFDILLGKDDTELPITLENVVFKQMKGFVHSILRVRFALIGCHITSFDTKYFTTAVVHYPYLRTWAFHSRIRMELGADTDVYSVDMSNNHGTLLSAPLDDMDLVLWSSAHTNNTQFDFRCEQDTYLNLHSHNLSSINEYLKSTSIFSRFLSLSLYKTQYPNNIALYGEKNGQKYELLFHPSPSYESNFRSLINFNKFEKRLPTILYQWYKNFDKISPIAAYLADSLSSHVSFDSPDFLLIVQALDGYFKRFKNKQDGTDTRKNIDALNKLLLHFGSISAIKECQLDADVIVQTRDYYTHLLEENEKPKAVTESSRLIWLTEKCKILLTCCILEYSGMSMQEINTCCEESPIKNSLYWIKLHESKDR